MQSISFSFDLKPMPTNQLNAAVKVGNNVRLIKTKKAREFKKSIVNLLTSKKHEIFKFQTHYSENETMLACHIVVYLDDLLTKKGTINKRSIDIDNCTKALLDAIFECFDEIDDSAITDLIVQKRQAKSNKTDVTFHLSNINLK